MMLVLLLVHAVRAAHGGASCAAVRGGAYESEAALVAARCGACAADAAPCLAAYASLRERWRGDAVPHVLQRGGFACVWGVSSSWRYGHGHVRGGGRVAYAYDEPLHDAFDALCGVGGGAPGSSSALAYEAPKSVVAVLHNGLGNQLFQYAFGLLLADALGAVLESTTGLGRPGISSSPSALLKSNSFSIILEPLVLAS